VLICVGRGQLDSNEQTKTFLTTFVVENRQDMNLYLAQNAARKRKFEGSYKTVEIANEQTLPKLDWNPSGDSPYDPAVVEPNNEIVIVQKTGRRMYCRRCQYEWVYFPRAPKGKWGHCTCPRCRINVPLNSNQGTHSRY